MGRSVALNSEKNHLAEHVQAGTTMPGQSEKYKERDYDRKDA